LVTQSCTLVLTSHDRAFLDNVVEETIALRQKQLKYFEGTPSAMEISARKEARKLSTQKEALDKRKEHVSLVVPRLIVPTNTNPIFSR
jgi:ATP-binding cassette, subfamily F, member 3